MNKLTLRKLLWIDGIAALTAGVFLGLFKSILSPLFQLPLTLLTTLCIISFCYAPYSFYLAKQKNVQKRPVQILVIANFTYACLCLFLVFWFINVANPLGTAYLLFDFFVVVLLAGIEYRQINLEFKKQLV